MIDPGLLHDPVGHDPVGGVARQDFAIDREVLAGDRAVPDLMIAFAPGGRNGSRAPAKFS
jgi:hypothetical protein